MKPKDIALEIASAALDKQASSLEIINVTGKVSYADYIVICSGRSLKQVDAITNAVEAKLKQFKILPLGVEGKQSLQWVLVDFGDVVFHVFDEKMRGFYDLDGLWIDAEKIVPPDSVLDSAKSSKP